jgi:hypothetical protein
MKCNINSILFLLITCNLIAGLNEDITSKYNLDIGNYLLPAAQKVQISNWLEPSIEDYYKLQHYLSYSARPELKYLNTPECILREKVIRRFQLIDKKHLPLYEIQYINEDSSHRKNCIVTYVSMNAVYIRKQRELIHNLKVAGFNGHIIRRIGGWPATEMGSLEYFDVPYAFKIYALLEARKLGYENCLWLDVSMVPLTDLSAIFKHIDEHGVFFHTPEKFDMNYWINDFSAEVFGTTMEEFRHMPAIFAWAIGINSKHHRGMQLLDSWHNMLVTQKLGFLSFIPEQAPLCILAHRFNLLPFTSFPLCTCRPDLISTENPLCFYHNF